MKHLFRVSVVIAALCALASLAVAQDKVDVSGTWDFKIESPQRTTTPVVSLKAEGGKLTGTMKSPRGETPVTGTITGKEIKLSYTINFQGNELAITMTGTVEGDSMKGTADFGGFATGNWSATRQGAATAAAPAPAAASATSDKTDITGSWVVTVETDQGTGSPSFTFKQEGEKLSGTYKGMFGEAPVQGTVKGKDVTFSFKVSAQGMEGTIVYTGVIEKDSMNGTVKLGDLGSGSWTAKRQ